MSTPRRLGLLVILALAALVALWFLVPVRSDVQHSGRPAAATRTEPHARTHADAPRPRVRRASEPGPVAAAGADTVAIEKDPVARPAALRVRMRVVGASGPVPQFRVVATGPGGTHGLSFGPEGELEVSLSAVAAGWIVVEAQFHARRLVGWTEPSGPEIDLGDIVLDEGALLEGVVVWPDGTPIHGAKVNLTAVDAVGRRGTRQSAGDGAFEYRHLARTNHALETWSGLGHDWELEPRQAEYWAPRFGHAASRLVMPGGAPVRVVLTELPALHLRFVDARTGERAAVREPTLRAGTRDAPRFAGSHLLGTAYGVAVGLPIEGPWRVWIGSESHETVELDLVNLQHGDVRDLRLDAKESD